MWYNIVRGIALPKIQLPSHKEQAALLLSQGHKQAEVARIIHRTPQTIVAWRKQEDFEARVAQLRDSATGQAVDLLKASLVDAAKIVIEVANKGGVPGVVGSKLRAALWILESAGLGSKKGPLQDGGSGNVPPRHSQADLMSLPEDELSELLERGNV